MEVLESVFSVHLLFTPSKCVSGLPQHKHWWLGPTQLKGAWMGGGSGIWKYWKNNQHHTYMYMNKWTTNHINPQHYTWNNQSHYYTQEKIFHSPVRFLNGIPSEIQRRWNWKFHLPLLLYFYFCLHLLMVKIRVKGQLMSANEIGASKLGHLIFHIPSYMYTNILFRIFKKINQKIV